MSTTSPPPGPPYAAQTASLGLLPTHDPDIPLSATFLLLFALLAIAHMTILQLNLRRGHKFLMSGMLFGFSMARITTMVMRIVWAVYPHNVRIALAANIFVAAGVVLVFVVNLLFAQRLLRAMHPHFGWSRAVHWGFIGVYILIVTTLIMLITAVIQTPYTLSPHTKHIDRAIQLYGATFYTLVAFLPIPITLLALILPRSSARPEKFGEGRWRHKIGILIASAVLMTLGAGFRAGVNFAGGLRPISDPAPYQSKACFYIFNFGIEVVVSAAYVVLRVDRRFHVPDGSHGPGDYARGKGTVSGDADGKGGLEKMISTEEEVFDGVSADEHAAGEDMEKGISKRGDEGAATVQRPLEARVAGR